MPPHSETRNPIPETRSTTLTVSLSELRQFATNMAASLHGGEVLALQGDLGAGKTTFVQFLAKELGVLSTVNSPTFGLHKQYSTDRGFDLHHFDWYRLSGADEVAQLGVEELFGQPEAVTVIEWPERAADLLPDYVQRIGFDYVDAETRRITVHTRSVG